VDLRQRIPIRLDSIVHLMISKRTRKKLCNKLVLETVLQSKNYSDSPKRLMHTFATNSRNQV
jgi:hypothetical protein